MTSPEMNLLNNGNARVSAYDYWLGSPDYYDYYGAYGHYASTTGSTGYSNINNNNDVRPSVSLTPGTEYTSGDGSMTNPYVVKTN